MCFPALNKKPFSYRSLNFNACKVHSSLSLVGQSVPSACRYAL
jgi:hypothetical protein